MSLEETLLQKIDHIERELFASPFVGTRELSLVVTLARTARSAIKQPVRRVVVEALRPTRRLL